MLLSHMESKGQRWSDPNVRLGEIGDVSSSATGAFNYGFSDIMMNNFWAYDFNMFDESQNNQFSGFAEQGLSEFAVTDSGLSSRFELDALQHNIENDDPNSVKSLEKNDAEKIESKVTGKCLKRTRSKRCRRTVFEGSWSFGSSPSMERNGSADNQGSVVSKRSLGNDVSKPAVKKRKDKNLVYNDNQGSVMSKKTLVNDVSEPVFKKQKGKNLENNDNQGSVMSKKTSVNDVSEPVFKKQKGKNLANNDNQGSVMSKRTLASNDSEPAFKKQKGLSVESNDLVSEETVSVNSVSRWLEDVGFARYADVFEMHEVDEEALALLTLDDLKEMGVLAVGTRRKLYAAICGLRGGCESEN